MPSYKLMTGETKVLRLRPPSEDQKYLYDDEIAGRASRQSGVFTVDFGDDDERVLIASGAVQVNPITGDKFTYITYGVTDLRVNAVQAVAPNTTTDVVWHEAVEDTLSAWPGVGADAHKIIVPAGANAMRVHGHVEYTISAAPGTYRSARMYVNGASPAFPYNSAADVRGAVGTISDHQGITMPFCRCTPGDYLTLSVRHNDTTTPTINILNTSATRFMVEWLKAL